MIVQIRVDDRLIHGQVALVWTKELNTPGIVVANDNAAKTKAVQMTLQMATPTGKKLLIRSVQDAIRVFLDPRGKDMRLFVLVNAVQDAATIVAAVPGVQAVNVANVGRFTQDAQDAQALSSTVMLTPPEVKALRQLAESGVPTFSQVLPSNAKQSVQALLKNAK
ncbi:PTS sugar transporter subunit IIB [Lacticaseibacillus suihuaensis]